VDAANPAALRRLLAGGSKLNVFSPAIMDACYKAAMELHAKITKDNPSFNKVNDSMREFTKNGYRWFSVAELHYDALLTNRMRG
jgi:TRAP-type mannitol/chloroaromatic compound transport system substrate-binding protein